MRAKTVYIQYRLPSKGAVAHLVIDATGIKVFGEGEWKQRKYGQEQRRVWRKLYLAVDAQPHEDIAAEVSLESVGGSKFFPPNSARYVADSGKSVPMRLMTAKPATGSYKRKALRQPYSRAKRRVIGNKGIHEMTPWRH